MSATRSSASPPDTVQGVQGVAIYMAIYLAMTLGAFACILAMRRENLMYENIEDLSGLARTHPVIAFCFAAMMFSLAGIPPLAGFFAKFYVFAAAIEAGLFVLAVIGVVTSVVGAYYYIRIVKVMYFDEPVERLRADAPESQAGARADHRVGRCCSSCPGIPSWIVGAADAAARSLF